MCAVLAAGGDDFSKATNLASAELYDPSTGKWAATGAMADAHSDLQMVFVAGVKGGSPARTVGRMKEK